MKIVIDLGDIGIESDDALVNAIFELTEFRPIAADLFKGKSEYVRWLLNHVLSQPEALVTIKKLDTSRVVAEVLKDMEERFPAGQGAVE